MMRGVLRWLAVAGLACLTVGARAEGERGLAEARMRAAFARIDSRAPYACGFATSMVKVFPRDVAFEASVSRWGNIELAGNEVESLQLLVLADKQRLEDVNVTVGALARTDGADAVRPPRVRVSPMGFVNTPKPPYGSKYIGWYPDPILDFLTSVDIKPGEMQPMWVEVNAPAGTPAGEYEAAMVVQPANAPAVKLGLRVKVWGFDVPAERHLRTALSYREPSTEQVYGTVSERLRQKYYDFLLDHRLNPDNIYRYDPPRIADLVRWDRRGMNAFNITYAVKPSKLEPNAPYPEDKKSKILAQLDEIVPQLKQRGLYEKAYLYGFDEVHPDTFNAMKDIFSAIKARYPDLTLLTTAYDGSYGEKTGLDAVDAWCPLTKVYSQALAEKVRAKGKQVWWYICIVPKAPCANWLIEYDAVDARSLMGLQTVKYKPDGFLYYALNRWPLSKKPITEGPYTDWPTQSFNDCNGDGSVMCAGPDGPLSTIRLENIRDGIEDYEYFWLLSEEIKRIEAMRSPWHAATLRRAKAALAIGDDMVKSVSEFSKSPEAIYAKRRQVAEAIVECKEAGR